MSDLKSQHASRKATIRGILRSLLPGLLPVAATVCLGLSLPLQRADAAATPDKKAAAPRVDHRSKDPGERAFQANCSRCHNPPEALSPRISGTVLRHMRVRANLSAEDERLILGYLNP